MTPVCSPFRSTFPLLDEEELLRFQRFMKAAGIFSGSDVSGSDVGSAVHNMPAVTHLVEGLLPVDSVNLLVGDSGIGKSALAYQLGLSVAAGIPFLELPVPAAAGVLLIDFENSLPDARCIVKQQLRHLHLTAFPDGFMLWPAPAHLKPASLLEPIVELAPDLIIIDSLRSFNPGMERDNQAAALQIKQFRELRPGYPMTFLLVHHLRKQRRNAEAGNLESGRVLDWLLQTAGAQALINQTDVRLAVSPPSRQRGDIALVLRGHARTRGEVGPFLLRRCFDGDGESSGYRRLTPTPELLENPEHEAVWQALPASFGFRDVRLLYGKHDELTNRLLHDFMRLGLVRRVEHGKYEKSV